MKKKGVPEGDFRNWSAIPFFDLHGYGSENQFSGSLIRASLQEVARFKQLFFFSRKKQ